MFPRVKKRVKRYMDDYVRGTMSQYETKEIINRDYHIKAEKSDYSMFPVWMVYSAYQNAEYTFAMNGQTGKIAGQPPVSKGKVVGYFLSTMFGIFIVLRIITVLLGGPIL